MLFTTILKQTIQLAIPARAAYRKRTEGRPKPKTLADLADPGPPSSEENKLEDFLLNQKIATVYMLTAIMYLGRGDFDDLDLLDRYAQMTETFDSAKRAVGQMLEKVPLPDYLQEGLNKLAGAGFDIDEFMESKS